MIVAAVIVPLLWFGPDLIGAGGALDASHTARGAASPESAKNASIPALAVLVDMADVLTLPALIAAVIAVVAGGPLARRIAAAAAAWIAIVAAMTLAGYAGNPRYLVAAAALGAALAGVGAVRAAGAAGAAILVAAVLATTARHAARPGLQPRATAPTRPRRSTASIAAAGGRDALARCARIRTSEFARSLVAWRLDLPLRDLDATPDPPRGRDPRPLVLRRRPRTAAQHRATARSPRRPTGRSSRVLAEDKGVWPFILAAWRSSSMAGPGTGARRAIEAAREGVERAVEAGHAVLADGGDALDAAQAAVIVLEDDPVFNAGRGAVLDERGFVLLDASVMRGADRAAGAVAGLRGIRNPVLAARAVLEEGRHVMLAGEAAAKFAREAGLDTAPEAWFRTVERQRAFEGGGTVGAVARDAQRPRRRRHLDRRHERQAPRPRRRLADHRRRDVGRRRHGRDLLHRRRRGDHPQRARARDRRADAPRATCRSRRPASARSPRLAPFGTGGLIAVGADGAIATPFTTAAMPRAWRVGDGPTTVAIDG